MSDFDPDQFLNSLYPNLGVGGMTMVDPFDELFPPSTSGVGVAASSPAPSSPARSMSSPSPSPPPPPPSSTLSAVGVGSVTSRTMTVGGKRPRSAVAGKRLPNVINPHRRTGGPSRRRRRRRSLMSSTTNTTVGGRSNGGGGDGGGSSDDNDSDVSSSSSSSSNPGGRHRMSQEELRRQLEMLSNDQIQTASGRRIAGITTTNTITTTYKDGGRPRVARHSSRVSH